MLKNAGFLICAFVNMGVKIRLRSLAIRYCWQEFSRRIGVCDGQDGSWVTDFRLEEQNVYQIMRGGRARWKIENETFNTLKNQDYQFEHNFGHGNENLSVVFAMLMMLAFLVDQTQEEP